jgi:hypothetical protein
MKGEVAARHAWVQEKNDNRRIESTDKWLGKKLRANACGRSCLPIEDLYEGGVDW